MKTSRLLCALGLLLSPLAPATGQVLIELSLGSADALDVHYRLPEHCTALPFLKDGKGAAAIRSRWEAQGGCGTASGGALTANCRDLHFKVPATLDKVTGFAGSYPIGSAMYVHTSNYDVGDSCGTVSYRFNAPAVVVLQGQAFARTGTAKATGGGRAVLLTREALPPSPGPISYFAPSLSGDAVRQIRAVIDGTIETLRAALPDAALHMPVIVAANAAAPGGVGVSGDADDVLRLSFLNWPAVPGPDDQRTMTLFVSHEISHRFQMRDAVDVYPDARLIHEGGGELLRWFVALRRGWITPAQAADDVDDALFECMLKVGERRWGELAPGEIESKQLPYRCGLPAYVYALSVRQGQGGALARINDFYRDLRLGMKPGFASAIECGAVPCSPTLLPALLGKEQSMQEAWRQLFARTALARPAAPGVKQHKLMMDRAFSQLMKSDCGESSFFPTAISIIIDDVKTCKNLKPSMKVKMVEGLPVFGDVRTVPAMAAACKARGNVVLGLADGSDVTIACAQAFDIERPFYRIDIERVLKAL